MAEDVTEKEAEKSPKAKTADKPHHISLILSIAAIVISSLGWWESHSNRVINEEVNRPVLLVSSVQYNARRESNQYFTGINIDFKITLKNTGKITAKLFKQVVEADLENNRGSGRCIEFPLGDEGLESEQEILPGMETELTGHASVGDDIEPECRNFPLHIDLFIRTLYSEGIADKPYNQFLVEKLDIPQDKVVVNGKVKK
jgi:hypothetical protein